MANDIEDIKQTISDLQKKIDELDTATPKTWQQAGEAFLEALNEQLDGDGKDSETPDETKTEKGAIMKEDKTDGTGTSED